MMFPDAKQYVNTSEEVHQAPNEEIKTWVEIAEVKLYRSNCLWKTFRKLVNTRQNIMLEKGSC